jgi:hypothetical protein
MGETKGSVAGIETASCQPQRKRATVKQKSLRKKRLTVKKKDQPKMDCSPCGSKGWSSLKWTEKSFS